MDTDERCNSLITDEQKRMLLELLVANDILRIPRGRERALIWQTITEQLNGMKGAVKTTTQWKNTWWNIKKRAKHRPLPDYLKNVSKGVHMMLSVDETAADENLPCSETAQRDSLILDVTEDDCCEFEDETNSLPRISNSLDYCRQLIRAVANGIRENKNEEEVFSSLCNKLQHDCKKRKIWSDMKTLTINKLDRLLEVSDRGTLLAPEHRMTMLDWLLFDTVLIYQNVDVIGISDTEEKQVLRYLFTLVMKYNVESLTGDELADAWSCVTLNYNKNERQCTPMLLQRRWYQMKLATRARYCKFWSLYKSLKVPPDLAHQPTQLQKDIATWHKALLVEPFMLWEDLIKNNRVILREQFELIALNRRMAAKRTRKPQPPAVVTIDLDADDDTTATELNHASTQSEIVKEDIKIKTDVKINKEEIEPTSSTATITGDQNNPKYKITLNKTVDGANEEVEKTVLPIITIKTENLRTLCRETQKLNESSDIENDSALALSAPINIMGKIMPIIVLTPVLSNSLGKVPNDTDFADEGISLQDDGSTLNTEKISKEPEGQVETSTKTEDRGPTNPDNTANATEDTACTEAAQLKRLLQIPIVYTVKLDDMGILPVNLLHHVDNKGIIDIINFKSKPTLKNKSRTQSKQITSKPEVKTVEKKVKLSSPLFQKPQYCTYPDEKLIKNPDFNITILFDTVSGNFFQKIYNNTLLAHCKPLTVDLSKEFEKELVNGKIYLDTSESNEGLSSTGKKSLAVKPQVRYLDVNHRLNKSIPRIRKMKSLLTGCPVNPSVISNKPKPKVTNSFIPMNLDDILSEVNEQLSAIVPKSNDNTGIKSKGNNSANILSDVNNSYICESLPSLDVVGSVLSILNKDGSEKKSTMENPEIECSSNQVNISENVNMSYLPKPSTSQTFDDKQCYTDKEIHCLLKRAFTSLNIQAHSPLCSNISDEDLNTEDNECDISNKHAVADHEISKQNSNVISVENDNTADLVNDILKKAVDSNLLEDSTFHQTSLKLNADLLLDMQSNSNSSKSSQSLDVYHKIEHLVLSKLKKADIKLSELYKPQAIETTHKIKKTDNQVADGPQRSGKKKVASKSSGEVSRKNQKHLKIKDSLYSYIGSKRSLQTQNKNTSYCCRAGQRMNDVKTKRNTVSRHKCSYPNCSCCCRDILTEFKYFCGNPFIISSGETTENDVTTENYVTAENDVTTDNYITRNQSDYPVTIKEENDVSENQLEHSVLVKENNDVIRSQSDYPVTIKEENDVSGNQLEHSVLVKENNDVIRSQSDYPVTIKEENDVSGNQSEHSVMVKENNDVSRSQSESLVTIKEENDVSGNQSEHSVLVNESDDVTSSQSEIPVPIKEENDVTGNQSKHSILVNEKNDVTRSQSESPVTIKEENCASRSQSKHSILVNENNDVTRSRSESPVTFEEENDVTGNQSEHSILVNENNDVNITQSKSSVTIKEENDASRSQSEYSISIKEEPDLQSNTTDSSSLTSNMSAPKITAFSSGCTQTETTNITHENSVCEPSKTKTKMETDAECTFSLNNFIGRIIQKEYSQPGWMPFKRMVGTKPKPFTSMFLGKNKVLLTTIKLPPNLARFKEFTHKLKQTLDLPKYIQLRLLPSGRVTLYRHPDFEVSEELQEKLTKLIDEFYHRNNNDVRNATNYQCEKSSIHENISKISDKLSEVAADNLVKNTNNVIKSKLGNTADDLKAVNSGDLNNSNINRKLADVLPISQGHTIGPLTPCEQDTIDAYTAHEIQSGLGYILSKILTPITNMTELKYAYSNKGLFFKFDLISKLLQPMNICIKGKRNKNTLMDSNKPKEFTSDYLTTASFRADLTKNLIFKNNVDSALTVDKELESTQSDAISVSDDSRESTHEKSKRKYDQITSNVSPDNSSEYEPLAKIKMWEGIQNVEMKQGPKLTNIIQEFVKDRNKSVTNNVLSGNKLVNKNNNSTVSNNIINVLSNVLLNGESLNKTNLNNTAVADTNMLSDYLDSKSHNQTPSNISLVNKPQNKTNLNNVSVDSFFSSFKNNTTNNGSSDDSLDVEPQDKINILPEGLLDTDSQMESYIDNASSDGSVDSDLLNKSNKNSVSADDFNTTMDISDDLVFNKQQNNSKLDNTPQFNCTNSQNKDISSGSLLNDISPNDSEQQSKANNNNVSSNDNESQINSNESIPSSAIIHNNNVQNSNDNIISSNNIPASQVQSNGKINNVPVDNCFNSESNNNDNNSISLHKSLNNDPINESKTNDASSSLDLNSGLQNKSDNNYVSPKSQNKKDTASELFDTVLYEEQHNKSHTDNVSSNGLLDKELQDKNNTKSSIFYNLCNDEAPNKSTVELITLDDSLDGEPPNNNYTNSILPDDFFDCKTLNTNNFNNTVIDNNGNIEQPTKRSKNVASNDVPQGSRNEYSTKKVKLHTIYKKNEPVSYDSDDEPLAKIKKLVTSKSKVTKRPEPKKVAYIELKHNEPVDVICISDDSDSEQKNVKQKKVTKAVKKSKVDLPSANRGVTKLKKHKKNKNKIKNKKD